MSSPRVALLGAGITGLTAAWHLRRAGAEVTVFEAGTRAGGVICSRREGPWLAEGGPNTILETSPKIAAWIEALGLAGRRTYSDPAASARFIVRNARPVPLPTSGPSFFLGSTYSARAKLRLLAEPFIGRAAGEESVAQFVERRLGREFLDYAIDPLVTGIYAGDPARLSVQHAFPRIHALETTYGSLIRGQILGARERRRRGDVSKDKARKFSFDDGLQVLTDTAHAALQPHVRLGHAVESVGPLQDGWRISTRGPDGERSESFDAVLLTGNAHTLGRLRWQGADLPALTPLSEIEHPPVTSVVLGFQRDQVRHPCQGFGILIPYRERFEILGTLFSSSLFPGRAPAQHLTLTTYVGGARNPEAAQRADGPLVDSVVRELDRLFGVTGRPAFVAIQRWARAIPQYNVGHGRYKALLEDIERRAPGLFIAGHYRDGVALSDSILTGMRSAERILAHCRPTQAPLPA